MKRIFLLSWLALGTMLIGNAHAASTEAEQIKAHMVENYLLWQIAVKIGDADRVVSFESPEFTRVLQNGDVTSKTTSDAAMRLWMSRIRKVYDAKVTIKKITIEPHRVVIWSVRELDADMNSGTNPNEPQQVQRIHFVGTTRDTWVKYRDHWVIKRMENLTFKGSIDGKPFTDN